MVHKSFSVHFYKSPPGILRASGRGGGGGEAGAVREGCYSDKSCVLDAVTSSGILKAKQKLGVTFNSDKLGGIDFTKILKLSMCSAGAGRCWLVQWPGLPPRHCTWSVLKFL